MEENQPTQEVVIDTPAVAEKPKRGRPRKQQVKAEPVVDATPEPVAEATPEPVVKATPVTDQGEPEALPEVVVEPKTPRHKVVKRTKSVVPKNRKKSRHCSRKHASRK